MRNIVLAIIFAFVFFGCTPKQVVQLKMPGQQQQQQIQTQPKVVDEDKTTVVEEFQPIEVFETDVKEQIMDNSGSSLDMQNIDMTKAKIKIAFVYPTLLDKYARTAINTMLGYLTYQESDHNLMILSTSDESLNSIKTAFSKLEDANISKVIALYSPKALDSLNQVANGNFEVYLPLIEKNDSLNNDNLIFGSISYEDQLKKLSYQSNGQNVIFSQNTFISRNIKNAYDNVVGNSSYEREIGNSEKNFNNIVKSSRLGGSSFFINLDLMKTAMVLSQLSANNINPSNILLTQNNFDTRILTLTQDHDRQKALFANSIDKVDSKLTDIVSNFGGNIEYEWVDYSVLVGTNYLYYGGNSKVVPTRIVNNKVEYEPKLYKAAAYGFVEVR